MVELTVEKMAALMVVTTVVLMVEMMAALRVSMMVV